MPKLFVLELCIIKNKILNDINDCPLCIQKKCYIKKRDVAIQLCSTKAHNCSHLCRDQHFSRILPNWLEDPEMMLIRESWGAVCVRCVWSVHLKACVLVVYFDWSREIGFWSIDCIHIHSTRFSGAITFLWIWSKMLELTVNLFRKCWQGKS